MNVKKAHKEMVKELQTLSTGERHHHYNDSYTGSKHYFYAVPVPERRRIVKEWLKANKNASTKNVLALIDALISGESHEEKTMGAMLLAQHTDARTKVTFAKLNTWLGKLHGWAEIDAFCYNVFTADEMLASWKEWKQFLQKLSKDKNINKRRAALVYLTKPTDKSDDARLHGLAYALVDALKVEKETLITKAISWLLRSMAVTKPKEVKAYLTKNEETLPKIALRETRRKIETGKKN